MNKVVVLGGNARSGKSTLSNMLVRNGFSKISFDLLYDIFRETLNIEELDNETKFNIFKKVVEQSIEDSNTNNINIVIDMYDFLPSDIERLDYKNDIEVYFLAYPNNSIETIKENIIKYSKPSDWIAQVNENYLNECIKRFYDRNELLVNECNKYTHTLIDTKSGEGRLEVLNELFNKITKDTE